MVRQRNFSLQGNVFALRAMEKEAQRVQVTNVKGAVAKAK